MKLEFSGSPVVAVPRSEVWDRLLDPHFIARSAPGVESVEETGANTFRIVIGFGVALLKLRFPLDIELYDIIDQTSARMRARGRAPGSDVEMRSTISVHELGPRRVRLDWHAESVIHGTLAGMGARLMEGAVRKLTEQFWETFAERVVREARS